MQIYGLQESIIRAMQIYCLRESGNDTREFQSKGIGMFLEISHLKKSYGTDSSYTPVLRGVSLAVRFGDMCVIEGSSGSGKSTLLNCIGGLDIPDSGSICVEGDEITGLTPEQLSEYRRSRLGFVFQMYNLIPNLTIKENVEVCRNLTEQPLELSELLQTLGISEVQEKFPSEVSGGQQQRCAIARALVKNPQLLLCDEPTGALDSETSKKILVLLETVNKKYGTTILIVTHNRAIRRMVRQVVEIHDGVITKNSFNESVIPASELKDL
jgi:putative ABC transport system ATP-binding protein